MHSCSWFLWRPLTRYQSGGPWDGIKRLCPSTFYGFLCELLVERLGLGELLERGFCPPLCTLLPPLFPLLTSLACTLLSHAPSSPFTSSDFSLLLCPLLQALLVSSGCCDGHGAGSCDTILWISGLYWLLFSLQ